MAAAKLSRILEPDEPKTFREAWDHPTHSKEWRKGIHDEFNANGTWEVGSPSKGTECGIVEMGIHT